MRRRSSYVASCGIAERWPRFFRDGKRRGQFFVRLSFSFIAGVGGVVVVVQIPPRVPLLLPNSKPFVDWFTLFAAARVMKHRKLLPFPSIGCDSKPLPPLLLSLVNKIFGFSAVLRSFCMTESIFLNR